MRKERDPNTTILQALVEQKEALARATTEENCLFRAIAENKKHASYTLALENAERFKRLFPEQELPQSLMDAINKGPV